MKDGKLYCEVCGEEIHIVPDFEPEIEYSIHETLSGIVEEVMEEVPVGQDEPEDFAVKSAKKRKKIIIALTFVFVVLAIVITAFVVYQRQNSLQYQLSKAESCLAKNDIESAIEYYLRAIELDETNISLHFSLADLYGRLQMTKESLETLYVVIQSPIATENEVETAYKKIIDIYKSMEDYTAINTLLVNSGRENIKTMFQSYMALVPEFSYTEGNYAEVVPLKLTASTQGTIYYTMDGSIPDENSLVYTTPIFLETGKYTITAMFVNQYGIKSDVVKKTYVIDILRPSAPEVETYSGEYTTPTLIEVLVPYDCFVYYTTDGSTPNNLSAQYTAPLPMPLGKSTYKFVTYNKEGVSGDCTTRQFELELQTDVTPDIAIYELKVGLMAIGKIKDHAGTINADLAGRYLYQFQYAISIPDAGDFYVIDEIFEDIAGVQAKTGTTYAVDVYTQQYYRLSRGALEEYILEPF